MEHFHIREATEKDVPLILPMGAEQMSDWTVYRVSGEALAKLAVTNP